MDCGMQLVKFLIFGFNLLWSLAGLALIVLGALVHSHVTSVIDLLGDHKITTPAILVIVIGCIVFILAFLGCCGAAKESHCMLISYAVLLSCIFIFQVVIAVLAFVYRKEFEEAIEGSLRDAFDDYPSHPDTMNGIQSVLNCCGVDGPSDWIVTLSPFPESCCKNGFTGTCSMINKDLFKKGCKEVVIDLASWAGNVVGGIAIGVAAIELLGIVFACFLANSIKNEDRRRHV